MEHVIRACFFRQSSYGILHWLGNLATETDRVNLVLRLQQGVSNFLTQDFVLLQSQAMNPTY